METPGIEVKYPRTDQAFGMAYHNISPTHGEGWEDFSASIEGEMQKLEGDLNSLLENIKILLGIVSVPNIHEFGSFKEWEVDCREYFKAKDTIQSIMKKSA